MVKKIIQKNLQLLIINDVNYLIDDLMRKYSFELEKSNDKKFYNNFNSLYLIKKDFSSREYEMNLSLRINFNFKSWKAFNKKKKTKQVK